MNNPKNPYDPDFNQPQDTGQPARSGAQQTWTAEGQGTERGGMKSPSQTGMPTQTERTGEGSYGQNNPQGQPSQTERTGIAPTENEGKEGQTAPNLRDNRNPNPRKGGQGTYDQGTQTGGASQTGRSGGLDRNQDINKENREGEVPKSESDVLDEPPFDSRMPGEPPRGADHTAPDES